MLEDVVTSLDTYFKQCSMMVTARSLANLGAVLANGGVKPWDNKRIIPNEEAETIFVPFFTTRKDGNGVGLSLSRQIMKLSGGSISLLDAGTNGWNTTFLLEFE